MAKIEKLKAGDVVYDVGRTKMGNTTMSTVSVWRVHIKEVDPQGGWVLASWNGNASKKFYNRSIDKWRVKEPVLVDCAGWGRRLATREELKAMKAKATGASHE
jgi:hypothetical protein